MNGLSRIPLYIGSRLISKTGYDKESGLLIYKPDPAYRDIQIPDRPSRDQALEALNELMGIYEDFPMSDEARSSFLAFMLTLVRQYCFVGSRPLFYFDANVRGSGKALIG